MPIHTFIRFEPKPGKEASFRESVLRVNGPTRAEPGCIAINVFESVQEPRVFIIHSEWIDEAAFDLHARLPHTIQFVDEAKELLTHPVQPLKCSHLGGGPGAGFRPEP